ncbi:Pr6Pr family membrane protein [Streptomyces sp. YIM S03343]
MTTPIPRDIPDLPAIPGIAPLAPSPVPATAVVPLARRPLTAAFRALIAVAAAGAVTLSLLLNPPSTVLSYFSIQATIFISLLFTASAKRAWTARRPISPAVMAAGLLYTTIAALTYHYLRPHVSPAFPLPPPTPPSPTPAPWQTLTNITLHTAIPLAAALDWLLLTAPGHTHPRRATTWMLYPAAYLAFILTRGTLLTPGTPGRYLYPFLDVAQHGYKHTLGNALLLGLTCYALAVLLIAVDHARPNPTRHRAKTGFRLRPPVG